MAGLSGEVARPKSLSNLKKFSKNGRQDQTAASRTQKTYYHIVVADARTLRDGRFIETRNVQSNFKACADPEIDRERLMNGYESTPTRCCSRDPQI